MNSEKVRDCGAKVCPKSAEQAVIQYTNIAHDIYVKEKKSSRGRNTKIRRITLAEGVLAMSMLIAFDSTQQALRAEMLLEYANIEIDIRPTPKEITAGCAISIEFPAEDLDTVQEIIRSQRVEIKGIYVLRNGEYDLLS